MTTTMHKPHSFHPNLPHSLTIKRLGHQVAFRLVCHVSVVDALFGSSGSGISTIRSETGCGIHCDDEVPGSDHRVVRVVGPSDADRRIVFYEKDVREEWGEVSSAQEAVIRVFEKVWEAQAQMEGEGEGGDDVAYCGLLANTTQIGAVVGKRGKNVTRMRLKSGAKIRMLPPPVCAAKDDELIQIMGGSLAVKKALVAVTACLQEHPPIEKDPTVLNESFETVHDSGSPDPPAENFRQHSLSPPLSGNSSDSAPNLSPREEDRVSSPDGKGVLQEVTFRLLFSNKVAGGIIGKKGSIVRTLQNASGALITFAAPLTASRERVVTISALENLDTRYSPTQNAVVLVFARAVEVNGQQEFSSEMSKGAAVTARLLVGSELVGCLSGNGGRVVSEMIDLTGAFIEILGGENIMDHAAGNDVVIQITGKHVNVQNALFEVTGRLRNYLLHGNVHNEVRRMSPNGKNQQSIPSGLHQSVVLPSDFGQESNSTQGVNRFSSSTRSQRPQTEGIRHMKATTYCEQGSRSFGRGGKSPCYIPSTEEFNEIGTRSTFLGAAGTTSSLLHQSSGQSPDSGEQNILMKEMTQLGLFDSTGGPSKLQPSKNEGRENTMAITNGERGSIASAGGVEPQSGNKSVFVANTTIEIVVAEHIFSSVYGEDGCNLACLRQISGAKVEVRDPLPGKSEGMVIISGTPDQAQVAQSLLQAFVLVGQ